MSIIAIRLRCGPTLTSADVPAADARHVVDVINSAVADGDRPDAEIATYPAGGGVIKISIAAIAGAVAREPRVDAGTARRYGGRRPTIPASRRGRDDPLGRRRRTGHRSSHRRRPGSRLGRRRTGAPGTMPGDAAGTPGLVPAPIRAGTGRHPRVWTHDADAPGTDVGAIYDGVSYYRRTAADRWVPDGCSGPGFAWREVPAALRVEAAGEHRTGPDGALVLNGPVGLDASGFGGSAEFGGAAPNSRDGLVDEPAGDGGARDGHGQ